MSTDEDTPYLGMKRGGSVLVLMGDDSPEQCEDWLEAALAAFSKMSKLVESESLDVDLPADWREFCEQIGVTVKSEFWEGSMISGQFVLGWVSSRGEELAKRRSQRHLTRMMRSVRSAALAKVSQEIREIDDPAELLVIVREQKLPKAISAKEAEIRHARTENDSLKTEIAKMRAGDTSQLANQCIRLVLGTIKGEREARLAGPLALWTDGAVYAITKLGGVPLPPNSVPDLIVTILNALGKPVHEIEEVSTTRGYLSGPKQIKGGTNIAEWADAWSSRKSVVRTFRTQDPAIAEVANQIADFAWSQLSGGRSKPVR